MLCLCVFLMLYLHVICCDWCVKPTTDGEHCKALLSVSNSMSAQLKANSICSIWYVPHTVYYSPSNSVSVWKSATISRKTVVVFAVGGVGLSKRPARIQNGGVGCEAAGSCGSDGKDLWPWFPGCRRCWHPADSACHCNAGVQTPSVTPSRLELRTHLNLDTDQKCIKYLTVELT